MNFKIPNSHRNNSYRNEPTYLPPGHSTKPSVRRQKFHALMEEIDAKTAPTSIVAIKFVVVKEMSALGQKQTCAVQLGMSAKCQKRTSNPLIRSLRRRSSIAKAVRRGRASLLP